MADLIDRQAAIDETWKEPTYTDPLNVLTEVRDRIKALPSVQPEITPDGTLNISVGVDVAKVGRILLSQTGTQRGGLYYKDAQPEEDCDTCKHGYFGDEQCGRCRVRYPSRYERRPDEA